MLNLIDVQTQLIELNKIENKNEEILNQIKKLNDIILLCKFDFINEQLENFIKDKTIDTKEQRINIVVSFINNINLDGLNEEVADEIYFLNVRENNSIKQNRLYCLVGMIENIFMDN